MKKNIYSLILISLTVLFSNCERTIYLDNKDTEELSLLMNIKSGEPLKCYIYSTSTFTEEDKLTQVADANLTAIINNDQEILFTKSTYPDDTPNVYICNYTPNPGDKIKIIASHPILGTAEGETTVPHTPNLSYIESKVEITDMNGFEKVACGLTVTLKNNRELNEYYRVKFIIYRNLTITINNKESHTKLLSTAFNSNNNIFYDPNITKPIWGKEFFTPIFNDKKINGEEQSIHSWVTLSSRYRGTTELAGVIESIDDGYAIFTIESITEDFYNYIKKQEALACAHEYDINNISASVPYSNIKGGYGIIGASAVKYIAIDLKTNKEIPIWEVK